VREKRTNGFENTGWMKLDKLHILQRQTCSRGDCHAVAGAGMRRGAREITPSSTARCHDLENNENFNINDN